MSGQSERDIEQRSKTLFDASVDDLDMRIRSRLTQARHAALDAASTRSRWASWSSAYQRPMLGAAAALVLAMGLWVGHGGPDGLPAVSESHSGFEDLELVASNDQMELLQDDLEFYDWVDKGPAADGAGSG